MFENFTVNTNETDASHRFTCFRQWRSMAGGKNNILHPSQTAMQSNGSISATGIGHMFIQIFLLRMTDTRTSQNIDLSSWDTLYIRVSIHVGPGGSAV
jgi:hypothetical protein